MVPGRLSGWLKALCKSLKCRLVEEDSTWDVSDRENSVPIKLKFLFRDGCLGAWMFRRECAFFQARIG